MPWANMYSLSKRRLNLSTHYTDVPAEIPSPLSDLQVPEWLPVKETWSLSFSLRKTGTLDSSVPKYLNPGL